MNIGEATATMRLLDFLAGAFDHEDDATRAAVARDINTLEARARKALMVGEARSVERWDDALCRVTFEGL
jgi:hypothetical protein